MKFITPVEKENTKKTKKKRVEYYTRNREEILRKKRLKQKAMKKYDYNED